jgi:hypothetical protein
MEKITIENTSLAKAYDDAVKKWRFKDREAMLKYAVAVMLEADVSTLIIKKRNDFGLHDRFEYDPSDDLIE